MKVRSGGIHRQPHSETQAFDREILRTLEIRGLKFAGYADDCIIVVKSEKAANRVLSSVTKFIEKKLGLKVNVIN